MESQPAKPLIVIVGETASGKTALGIELAKKFNGEIIAADSRTVYRGMDIGTAKPTKTDQAEVAHHLLDVINPDQKFNVSLFQKLAQEAIQDIHKKGKLPIIVGGTGLYIDSVLYNFTFIPHGQRNPDNPRHLMPGEDNPSNKELRSNTLIIGLVLPKDELKKRITHRVDDMFTKGFIEEAKSLINRYGAGNEALLTPGYKAAQQYLKGKISLEETKALFIQADLSLAKRQRTWFKRNSSIQWVNNPSNAVEIVTTFLNTKQ